MNDFIQLIVGGFPYVVAKGDIDKFPDSFFACLIKKEWSAENEQPFHIERDGAIFRYVNAYLVSGSLPRSKNSAPALDPAIIKRVKVEADFYGLTDLILQCKQYHGPITEVDLPNHLLMKKFVETFKGCRGAEHEIVYSSDLIDAFRPFLIPFCVYGRVDKKDWSFTKPLLYHKSTCADLNVAELVGAFAPPSSNIENDLKADSGVVEIDASIFNDGTLEAVGNTPMLQKLAPDWSLDVRPNKLVIHREGCSQELGPVLPSNREEGHIGTLVVILNSEYTGGELEVTHGGRTEVVTGPYSWVAMYGDCLHKINPVTSGTRVSLVYDIYKVHDTPQPVRNEWGDIQTSTIRSFWTDHYRTKRYLNVFSDKKIGLKGLAKTEKTRILDCMDAELANSGPDGVIIALQKLYPEYKSVYPAVLQDADRVLYDLLNADKYDVQIVTVIIHRSQEGADERKNRTRCSLFTTAAVAHELGISCGYDTDSDGDSITDKNSVDTTSLLETSINAPSNHHVAHNATAEKMKKVQEKMNAKVLLPYPLDVTGMIDHSHECWETGVPEQFVFLVTCLHVRKK